MFPGGFIRCLFVTETLAAADGRLAACAATHPDCGTRPWTVRFPAMESGAGIDAACVNSKGVQTSKPGAHDHARWGADKVRRQGFPLPCGRGPGKRGLEIRPLRQSSATAHPLPIPPPSRGGCPQRGAHGPARDGETAGARQRRGLRLAAQDHIVKDTPITSML